MGLSSESVDDLAMEADIVVGAVKSLVVHRLTKYFSVQEEYDQIKEIMHEMQSRVKRSSVADKIKDGDYSPKAISEKLEGDYTFNSFKTMSNAIRFYHGLLQQGH